MSGAKSRGTDLPPPRLKPGLGCVRLGSSKFILRDPASGEGFEINQEERFLLDLADGRHDLDEISRAYEREYRQPLSRRNLLAFFEQLHDHGLLEGSAAPAVPAGGPRDTVRSLRPPPTPLSADDAGAPLNHRFDLLVLVFGGLLHPAVIPVAGVLFVIGLTGLIQNFGAYTDELSRFVEFHPLRALATAISAKLLLADLPRAALRGMACRKFKGRVRSFGLRLHRSVLPRFQCDTGDSFAFFDDRGQWTLLTVGPVFQMALFSAVMTGWQLAPADSFVRHLCLILVLVTSVPLVMMAIPLTRGEAYWIVSRLAGVTDLHERAQREAQAFLRLRPSREALTARERRWFRRYGVLSLLWDHLAPLVVMAFLGWWLISRFEGVGALGGLVLAILWFQEAARQKMKQSWAGWFERVAGDERFRWLVRAGGPEHLRRNVRIALGAAALLVILFPYKHEVGGRCKVVPAAQYGARAQITDEVVDVRVAEGDWVEPGAVIAILSGRDAEVNLETTKAELASAQAELDLLVAGPRVEDIATATHEVELWKAEVRFAQRQIERAEQLLSDDATSEVRMDSAIRERDTAQQQLAIAEERLSKLRAGTREEEIRAAESEVARLQARVEYNTEQNELTRIVTPIRGRVVTPNLQERRGQVAKEGDLIAVVEDDSQLYILVAAEEAAAAYVEPGMAVKVRLRSREGQLLMGEVVEVSNSAARAAEFAIDPFRSDREAYQEQTLDRGDDEYFYSVKVVLEDQLDWLSVGMTGYARVVVANDVLGRAVLRPVVRFLRTEIWSWLP